MSSSSRPVYVPKRKRKLQQQQQYHEQNRLHGAFRGGFSAGYFNTVDTVEGWTPSAKQNSHNSTNAESTTDRDTSQKILQRPEDFMDAQDHDEWGGPTGVKAEYQGGRTSLVQSKSQSSPKTSTYSDHDTKPVRRDELHELFTASSKPLVAIPVGERLLRQLGWREGRDDSTSTILSRPPPPNTSTNPNNNSQDGFSLSPRRYRRIVKQQTRLDVAAFLTAVSNNQSTIGLGYDAWQDAPEFKAVRDRRTRQAAQRARQASSNAGSASAYRVSTVVAGRGAYGDLIGVMANDNDADDDAHAQASYDETMRLHDFVGRTSTNGFALADDDDDAYDETPTAMHRGEGVLSSLLLSGPAVLSNNTTTTTLATTKTANSTITRSPQQPSSNTLRRRLETTDLYDTIAYEHQESSDEDKPSSSATTELSGVLSSWAIPSDANTMDRSSPSSNPISVLSRTAPGFVHGGRAAHTTTTIRYRGPDLPHGWIERPHVFGEHDHPAVYAALARAAHVQQDRHRQTVVLDQALREATVQMSASTRQSHASQRQQQQTQLPGTAPFLSSNVAATDAVASSETGTPATVFPGVRAAFRNRFAPSSSSNNKSTLRTAELPETTTAATTTTSAQAVEQPTQHDYHIVRTVAAFAPASLLCKRFNVPLPAIGGVFGGKDNAVTAPATARSREEAYFFDEIMADAKRASKNNNALSSQHPAARATSLLQEKEQPDPVLRPSMPLFKSIFEPGEDALFDTISEDSVSEEETAEAVVVHNAANGNNTSATVASGAPSPADLPSPATTNSHNLSSTAVVPFETDKHRRHKKSKSSKHSKRLKRTPQSPDSEGSRDGFRDDRKQRKKGKSHRHDSKHRKRRKLRRDDSS